MKTKHTPGPWRVQNTSEIVFCDTILIADVYGVYKYREPNAKLIAAAPELLKACEQMCEVLERTAMYDKVGQSYYNGMKAIKKATT